MKLAIVLAVLTLATLLLLAAPVHADTPIPPIACGLPGWPSCEMYRHHIYTPIIEVQR